MFLKRNRRRKNGEVYEYWSLVETVRTVKGPRHRKVCNLGKLPGLDKRHQHGWEDLVHLLEGTEVPPRQMKLGESKEGVKEEQWKQVDIKGLRVERVRDFGEVYLALALWRRLGLHAALEQLIPQGREKISWSLVACLLVIARFCGNKSELEVAERWYQDSGLPDLLGVNWEDIYDNRLYRGLDVLVGYKDAICNHLVERYQSWFGVEFEFLLYDVTSTYFEGQAKGNVKATRGYSRDNRPDCKQVNIGLVVTPDGGLPMGYEVFEGNRADVSSVEDMVRLMEKKYGQAKRIWVMDRGMVSESNIEFLREREASYIVGTPKGQLRQFESQLLDQANWSEVKPGVEVKLAEYPDGLGNEQYVIARSIDRREKEAAMLMQSRSRLRTKLEEIQASLKKRPGKVTTVERRIGRWLGKYSRAERFFDVKIQTKTLQKKWGKGKTLHRMPRRGITD